MAETVIDRDRIEATIVDDLRYLLIVKRGEDGLHRHGVQTFAQRPYVGVIYDRRVTERRRSVIEPPTERRRADRRGRPGVDAAVHKDGAAVVSILPRS
jgi:hypothetical protein